MSGRSLGRGSSATLVSAANQLVAEFGGRVSVAIFCFEANLPIADAAICTTRAGSPLICRFGLLRAIAVEGAVRESAFAWDYACKNEPVSIIRFSKLVDGWTDARID